MAIKEGVGGIQDLLEDCGTYLTCEVFPPFPSQSYVVAPG